MNRLPLTVIGGYLGAGKTTLINRLLAAPHGLRLAVLVNDFGAINIDAALLASASEDTIELTNGCVCCAMTGDLFFAVGDMLDRRPRPDHLIVEASGIADPAKIAAVSQAEPDLIYGGILTLVDGLNIAAQLAEPRIAEQVAAQIRCADLLALSKVLEPDAETLAALGGASWISADDTEAIRALLDLRPQQAPLAAAEQLHPSYTRWALTDPPPMTRAALAARLAAPPPGVLRLKGLIPAAEGGLWEAHLVGQTYEIRQGAAAEASGLVVIGFAEEVTPDSIAAWWA